MDLQTALQSTDLGYIVLAAVGTGFVVLWRQNQWLTKQLLKLTSDTTQVLTSLLAELKVDPERRANYRKKFGPDPHDEYGENDE